MELRLAIDAESRIPFGGSVTVVGMDAESVLLRLSTPSRCAAISLRLFDAVPMMDGWYVDKIHTSGPFAATITNIPRRTNHLIAL